MAARKKLSKEKSGNVLIEFALLAPIFFMLIMGLVEFVLFQYKMYALNHVFYEATRKGFETYWTAITDPDAQSAMRLTLLAALIAVPLNALFGLAAAWAITKFDFRGKQLLISLIEALNSDSFISSCKAPTAAESFAPSASDSAPIPFNCCTIGRKVCALKVSSSLMKPALSVPGRGPTPGSSVLLMLAPTAAFNPGCFSRRSRVALATSKEAAA